MIPDRFHLFYILIIFQGHLAQCRKKTMIKPYEIDEHLLQRRCELMCYFQSHDKCTCRQNPTILPKPGRCPNSTNSILEKICLDDCKEGNDYECSGTKVCCKQECGYSCQDPVGLDDDPNLPPVPFNISISERRRGGKSCEVSWKIRYRPTQRLPIFFIVETRSHVGSVFSARKLEPWQWINFQKIAEDVSHDTMTKSTMVSIKLKMGVWYQIRVAAINEYGFRGYSNHTREFRLTDQNHVAEPKPPRPPRNLSVYAIGHWTNNTVAAKATWSAPKSDLPIDRYKISWARSLIENSSLYFNDDYVKEPRTSYEFTDLIRDALYYVQVQAISTIGGKRLKSLKESQMLNTATDVLITNTARLAGTTPKTDTFYDEDFKDLRIQFLPSRKYGMLVRVCSDLGFNGSFIEICSGTNDCETREYGTVRPHKDQTIFNRLKFETSYTLRVCYRNGQRKREVVKTFVTPRCETFKMSHPNLSISC